MKLKMIALALAPLAINTYASTAKTDALVKPLFKSETSHLAVKSSTQPCDDPELANFAQCNIENEANHFHWVKEEDYSDNIVQVVYGESTCGGLLVNGSYVITARHCTPQWNEGSDWQHGNILKLYQGIGSQDKNALVFSGVAEVLMRDSDQRVVDGINYLKDNWQPIAEQVEQEFLSRSPNNGVWDQSISTVYENIASRHSSTDLNDIAIIKLPKTVNHNSSSSFHLVDVFDINKNHTIENYNLLTQQPANTTFTYQGWGKNAYGATPSKMKAWDITFSRGQMKGEFNVDDTFDPFLTMIFSSEFNFIETCDSESLVNFGDSGTPLINGNNQVIGFASRISGCENGFRAEWSSHLPNFEFFKQTIDDLIAPTSLKETVYTDFGDGVFEFAVQNMSSNSISVAPVIEGGEFDLTHNCPQSLESLESCEMRVSYNGGFGSEVLVEDKLQLNSSKSIPLTLDVKTIPKPSVDVEPQIPSEIVLEIKESDLADADWSELAGGNFWDVSFSIEHISSPDNILVSDVKLEFTEEEKAFESVWYTIEQEGLFDTSDDPSVGVYKWGPLIMGVGFANKSESSAPAKPAIYTATLVSENANFRIPVTVKYLEDKIDTTEPDNGGGDSDGDDKDPITPPASGSSGGSLGFLYLLGLGLLATRRFN